MKIKKLLIIIFLLINFNNSLLAEKIYTLVKINNEVITNYDLFKEKQIIGLLEQRELSNFEQQILLEKLINEKIKRIEIRKNNIEIDKSFLEIQSRALISKYNTILTKIENEITKKMIKEYLYNVTLLNLQWNNLLIKKYRNKLEVNMIEIREIMKIKNLKEEDLENIVKIEKEKKINSLSKSYFNQIKKNYYVDKK